MSGNPLKLAAVVQAIKDDFCLYEVIDRLLSQTTDGTFSVEKVYLFNPDQYWSRASRSEADAAQVLGVAKRLCEKYGQHRVTLIKFQVGRISHFNQPRIGTETDCRNWYQSVLQKDGFEHAIILDSDELWRPGTLRKLCDCVREAGPNSACIGMIPVAGLPGFPVEGARDKATIYARTDIRFQDCRVAFGVRHEIPGNIFHFTATRRTMDEIVQKHRGSGHNGDPAYDFEGWIQNTLLAGRIKAGARSVHMYRQHDTWPKVRSFTAAEWAEIPASIKPYLAPPRLASKKRTLIQAALRLFA